MRLRVVRGGSLKYVPGFFDHRPGTISPPTSGTTTLDFVLPRTQNNTLFFVLSPFAAAKPPSNFRNRYGSSIPQAVQSCHELLLWLIPQLDKLPRARRFTLASDRSVPDRGVGAAARGRVRAQQGNSASTSEFTSGNRPSSLARGV